MKITALSLDSQLAILSQLPNTTLIGTIPLVCARWYRLQPHACLDRHRLNLIIGPIRHTKPVTKDHLALRPIPLNATCTAALTSTFPRITNLRICHLFLGFKPLHQQLYLLERWATTIVHLRIGTNVDKKASEQGRVSPQFGAYTKRLLAILNDQMPHLKSLSLTFIGQLPPSADLRLLLGRLVDFELICDNADHQHIVQQLLQHYSPTLERLSLGNIRHFPTFVPLLTCPFICSKLTTLKVVNFDLTQLGITFDCCSNLRVLYLALPTLKEYAERMRLLTKLPDLTVLSLSLTQATTPLDPVFAPVTLPVLPSIRHVAFFYPSNPILPSHDYFNQVTQLDRVFSQLQQIRLYWPTSAVSCQQCSTNGRHPNSCIDALLRPLARLETLQKAHVIQWRDDPNKGQMEDWMSRLCPPTTTASLG